MCHFPWRNLRKKGCLKGREREKECEFSAHSGFSAAFPTSNKQGYHAHTDACESCLHRRQYEKLSGGDYIKGNERGVREVKHRGRGGYNGDDDGGGQEGGHGGGRGKTWVE